MLGLEEMIKTFFFCEPELPVREVCPQQADVKNRVAISAANKIRFMITFFYLLSIKLYVAKLPDRNRSSVTENKEEFTPITDFDTTV